MHGPQNVKLSYVFVPNNGQFDLCKRGHMYGILIGKFHCSYRHWCYILGFWICHNL